MKQDIGKTKNIKYLRDEISYEVIKSSGSVDNDEKKRKYMKYMLKHVKI